MTATFQADGLKKVFNRRVIFEKISFSLSMNQTLLITGRNGSGKSTLVKILSDVLTPSAGKISISVDGMDQAKERNRYLGFVSPYLQLYDEFTAAENLQRSWNIRGLADRFNPDELLDFLGLLHRKDDQVRTYSSGMKQRVKYLLALAHRPPILILDEPTSHLDGEGIRVVQEIMRLQRERGILVVATNDLQDVSEYEVRIDLNAKS